jgi:hypothetical protein
MVAGCFERKRPDARALWNPARLAASSALLAPRFRQAAKLV